MPNRFHEYGTGRFSKKPDPDATLRSQNMAAATASRVKNLPANTQPVPQGQQVNWQRNLYGQQPANPQVVQNAAAMGTEASRSVASGTRGSLRDPVKPTGIESYGKAGPTTRVGGATISPAVMDAANRGDVQAIRQINQQRVGVDQAERAAYESMQERMRTQASEKISAQKAATQYVHSDLQKAQLAELDAKIAAARSPEQAAQLRQQRQGIVDNLEVVPENVRKAQAAREAAEARAKGADARGKVEGAATQAKAAAQGAAGVEPKASRATGPADAETARPTRREQIKTGAARTGETLRNATGRAWEGVRSAATSNPAARTVDAVSHPLRTTGRGFKAGGRQFIRPGVQAALAGTYETMANMQDGMGVYDASGKMVGDMAEGVAGGVDDFATRIRAREQAITGTGPMGLPRSWDEVKQRGAGFADTVADTGLTAAALGADFGEAVWDTAATTARGLASDETFGDAWRDQTQSQGVFGQAAEGLRNLRGAATEKLIGGERYDQALVDQQPSPHQGLRPMVARLRGGQGGAVEGSPDASGRQAGDPSVGVTSDTVTDPRIPVGDERHLVQPTLRGQSFPQVATRRMETLNADGSRGFGEITGAAENMQPGRGTFNTVPSEAVTSVDPAVSAQIQQMRLANIRAGHGRINPETGEYEHTTGRAGREARGEPERPQFQGGHGEFIDSVRRLRFDSDQRKAEQRQTMSPAQVAQQDLRERQFRFEQQKYAADAAQAQMEKANQFDSDMYKYHQDMARGPDGEIDYGQAAMSYAIAKNLQNPRYDMSDPAGVTARMEAINRIRESMEDNHGIIDKLMTAIGVHDGAPTAVTMTEMFNNMKVEDGKVFLRSPDKDGVNRWQNAQVSVGELDPQTQAILQHVIKGDTLRTAR